MTGSRQPAVFRLKAPYNNGTTHIAVDLLERMAQLAASIQWPGMHLIHDQGVLPINVKSRLAAVAKPEGRPARVYAHEHRS